MMAQVRALLGPCVGHDRLRRRKSRPNLDPLVTLEPRPFARALFGQMWKGRLTSEYRDSHDTSTAGASASATSAACAVEEGDEPSLTGGEGAELATRQRRQPDVAVKVYDARLALRHVTRVHGPEVAVTEDADTELRLLSLIARHPHRNLQSMHAVFAACVRAGTVATHAAEATAASGKALVAITPWCHGGDLWTLVINTTARQEWLPLNHVRAYAAGAASGLAHLHSLGWAHLDVSAENIFLARNAAADSGGAAPWSAVVADFGMARLAETEDGCMYVRKSGKEMFQAPEVWDAGYGAFVRGSAADVYSLGVVLFMMLAGQHPYLAVGDKFHVYTRQGRLPEQVALWRVTDRFASGALDLVQRMMHMDPDQRPTMRQVLQHPWLRPRAGGSGAAANATPVNSGTATGVAPPTATGCESSSLRDPDAEHRPGAGRPSPAATAAAEGDRPWCLDSPTTPSPREVAATSAGSASTSSTTRATSVGIHTSASGGSVAAPASHDTAHASTSASAMSHHTRVAVATGASTRTDADLDRTWTGLGAAAAPTPAPATEQMHGRRRVHVCPAIARRDRDHACKKRSVSCA